MVDTTYQPKVYRDSGGDRMVVASGGTLLVEAGGTVTNSGRQALDSTTVSVVTAGYAATITKWAAVVTTDALTTAHTASQAIVITKVGVVAGDFAMISCAGGTNTGGVPIYKAVTTTDTVTITLQNNAIATNAFNGTFIFNLIVFAK